MSSKGVHASTQFRLETTQDAPHMPLKVQTSSRSLRSPCCSLPQNIPALDSPNLLRGEEDLTLCNVLRSSECDLTACASASSSRLKTNLKNNVSLSSSLDLLLLAELPEIPDWYEDRQELKQEPEPERASATIPTVYTPTLNTPQSEYYSLDDYPTSLGCQNILTELVAGECGASELSNFKPNAKLPQTMPPHAPPHRCWRPQPLRRSYSFDLGDHRAAEFPYTIPLDAGLGYGLGSPFSPSPISFPIDSDSDHLHIQPAELQCASPPLSLPLPIEANVYLGLSPPGLRRLEALAVWRPQAPSPPPRPASPSLSPSPSNSDDAHSMTQPFPSTASIWVPDQPSSRLPLPSRPPLPSSDPQSVARKPTENTKMWTLEEQITIAVLQAMDSRDKRAAAGQQASSYSRLAARSGNSSNRKSKVIKLLGRIWRARGGVW
ncbi:hypothetical protein B0H12DRAFT_1241350 [Mycena haematopus]|nr:hypothetical protein B0H12DRAFT_1241350 [Mycena haematopus]